MIDGEPAIAGPMVTSQLVKGLLIQLVVLGLVFWFMWRLGLLGNARG
jgi:hypothetical protein